jgi:hypothetical protein
LHEVVKRAEYNVRLNTPNIVQYRKMANNRTPHPIIHAYHFDWDLYPSLSAEDTQSKDRIALYELMEERMREHSFDIVFGAEVMYYRTNIKLLISSCAKLVSRAHGFASHPTPPPPTPTLFIDLLF